VTLTGALAAVLPAASRATALRLCAPLANRALFQEMENGAVVSSATQLAPSTLNCTPRTPRLSEAEAEAETVPETVAPGAGTLSDTVGGVVSDVPDVPGPSRVVLIAASSK
jgi:hypothetical protein